MKRILGIVLTVFVMTFTAAAQEKGDAARNRVAEALAKGGPAAAEKMIQELAANLKPTPGVVPQWNTSYEEIRACGFYPQETRLECVLDIKLPFGYGGPIGSFGSFEYVSFFIDWFNDGFQMSDYVGSGIVNLTDGSAKTNFAV